MKKGILFLFYSITWAIIPASKLGVGLYDPYGSLPTPDIL